MVSATPGLMASRTTLHAWSQIRSWLQLSTGTPSIIGVQGVGVQAGRGALCAALVCCGCPPDTGPPTEARDRPPGTAWWRRGAFAGQRGRCWHAHAQRVLVVCAVATLRTALHC